MVKPRILLISVVLLLAMPLLASGQSADQLYAGGRQAFTDGLWSTAASQFGRLLREYPEDHRADSASYMGAVAYFNAGEHRRSIEILSAFPARYPDSPWNRRVAYWEGLARYELSDWSRAAAAFRRQASLREEPAYRERSLLYLGACLETLEEWQDAEATYAELSLESRDYETAARAFFRIGQIRLSADRPAEALEAFQRIAFEYPGASQSADIQYWMGESLKRMGRRDEALSQYRSFLATVYESPYRAHALLEAARLASLAGEDDEALAYLEVRDQERTSGTDDAADTVLRIQAASFLRLGMLVDARQAYRRIFESPLSDAERQSAAFDMAQTWLGTTQVLEAVPWLERAATGPNRRISADAAYTKGQILLVEGESRAADALEEFVDRFIGDDRREEVLRAIVKARRDAGDSGSARRALDVLLLDYPRSLERPVYLFTRGELALAGGDSTSALRDYDTLVEESPSSPYAVEARSRIGFIYADRGEHIRASEHYLEAARMAGGADGGESGRRAMYSAGVALLNGRDTRGAVETFKRLLEADPSGPWSVEAAYHMGEALYDEGDYAGARNAYESAARNGEGEWAFEAAYALGWTWFRESDWPAAAEAFERAAETAVSAEQRARSWYRVGLSLASSGNWAEALARYQDALEFGSGSWREEALYQQAWALLSIGRDDAAFEAAGILAEEYPGSELPADLPFRMGENAMAAGDFESAVSWYDRCRNLYPGTPAAKRAGLRAALAAREGGDAADSARRYEAWIAGYPTDPGVTAAARSWAGALKEAGDPDLAKHAMSRAIAADPDLESIAVPVILAWARILGVPAEAKSYLDDFAGNDGLPAFDRAEALLLRAHLFRSEGRYHRSRQVYEVIVRDVPGRIGAEAQEGLARSLAEEGQMEDAAEAYLSVPYLFPEETDLSARALREAERLYREAGRIDEADKLRDRIAGN